MREQELRDALLDARVPDAAEAEERAGRLVRAAYASAPPPLRRPRRVRARRAAQVALAVVLLAVVISPAGAAVRHWVRDTVDNGQSPAPLPTLTSLPTEGDLLVDSARGAWVVHEDGSKRLLGTYSQSTWSPHGLYVAATAPGQLLAIDPEGEVRWTSAHLGSVSDPAWSPDGYRIAYLNAGTLRVVGGDGAGDRPLEHRVAPLTPAWRPGPGHVITFAGRGGGLFTIDADHVRQLFETPSGPPPTHIAWSRDGSRLLVVRRSEISVLDRFGKPLWSRRAPAGMQFGPAAFAGNGDGVAAILEAGGGATSRSELDLIGPGPGTTRLFAGPGSFTGVESSPDGGWLLLSWKSADQWLFLDLDHPQRVVAVSDISAQFDPGTTSPPSFPTVSGWCCPDTR